ncbi:MAG: sulfatase [Phycisphaerae bacterium]|nr:sulfatase [Phycisphaerae bacterium]NUQ44635.1 sulfatase [Phycisphaerae bacterium]
MRKRVGRAGRLIYAFAYFLSLFIVLACTASRAGAQPKAPATQVASVSPSVVIYLIDTLRADRVGVYGCKDGLTPKLDALAAECVTFDQAYSAAPWTLPSIASLFTSTFLTEHGLVTTSSVQPEDLKTLGQILATRGYRSAVFTANAWSNWIADAKRGYPRCFVQKPVYDWNRWQEWFRREAKPPFHAYVHTIEPHIPYSAPLEFINRFGPITEEERKAANATIRNYTKNRLHLDDQRESTLSHFSEELATREAEAMAPLPAMSTTIRLLYDANVAWADENLGRFVQYLKDQGRWDDCLFVLLSDHGEEFGEHGGWMHGQSLHEELLRVPLLIHFPRGEFAGTRMKEIASLVDVMPTILDYMGCRAEQAECRGRNWLPVLRGETIASDSNAARVVAVRHNTSRSDHLHRKTRGTLNIAVREGPWKAIWNVDLDSLELYHLQRDPREQANLASADEETAKRLLTVAKRFMKNEKRRAPGRVAEKLDRKSEENLRELGYLGDETDDEDDEKGKERKRP